MPRPRKDAMPVNAKAPKSIGSAQSLSAFVKGVCDIMPRFNCASALQYVPELTWFLFLRILDAQELREREAAAVQGGDFAPALRAPFHWRDWAAPLDEKSTARTPEEKPFGWRREILRLKELHTQMRRSGVEAEALTACRELQSRAEKSKREAEARANAIDAAVYDLKAINPRARNERDMRTPREILESIAAHGKVVEQALALLRRQLTTAKEAC